MKSKQRPRQDNCALSMCLNRSRPLSTAFAMAFSLAGASGVTGFMPHIAYAQIATSQQEFSIPAGKLSDVLAQFAAAAGVPLSFDSQMLEGLESKGIQGAYTAQSGFSVLLAGTNFQLVDKGQGRYSLRESAGNITTLPAVQISGSRLSDTTEGTGAYIISETSMATKLKLAPRETPHIVNSVTYQMIEDFAAQDMEDVLSLVPGVSIGHSDDDRRSYTSRGYSMSIQYDGLPSASGIDGGVVAGPDSALIDRTEVLLGASGLMSGAGEPGGVINMVYKRPTDIFQGAGSVSFGAWEQQRFTVDISGPLDEEGNIRGRFIAVDQSEKSFRDYEQEKKKVFYVIVEGDVTDSTQISFSIQNQDIYDNVTDRSGLPADNDGNDLGWNQSDFLAPSWNRWDKYATTYKARLDQKLLNNWQLILQGSKIKAEADWLFATLSNFDSVTGDATFTRWAQSNEETNDDLELFLSGPVMLFDREHEIVIGGNWNERKWGGLKAVDTDYDTNLYAFDPQSSIPRPTIVLDTSLTDVITEQYGGYAAGHFNITDDLKAILGTRVSWYRYEYGATTRSVEAELTPYIGLIYDLNALTSAYFSYSDIFKPQTVRGIDGAPLESELGSNYEVGVKSEFYDGKLNASFAVFNIVKDNEAELISTIPFDATNICGGWCYAAKGKTVTKGFDIGLSGEVTEDIQVMAGFTQYKKSDNNETVNVAKLAGSYAPVGQDWSLGGNIDVSSKSYGQWGMSQDARTLVGIFGKYEFNPNINVALNIHNLLDEAYYANAVDSGYGRQYWGEPLSWSLTLNSQW